MTTPEQWNGRLSYSSFSQYSHCRRKYFLRKVRKVAPDQDAVVDTQALRFGSAYHALLEKVKHDVKLLTFSQIKTVAKEHEIEEEEELALLSAMVLNYRKVRKKSGLIAAACEVTVLTDMFEGYVDVVLINPSNGKWWIGDLKTASSLSQFLTAKLATDWQLNLYAAHAAQIAKTCGLAFENYQGCRYIVSTKSRIKRKANETLKAYIKRLEGASVCHEIVIGKEKMRPPQILREFESAYLDISSIYAIEGGKVIADVESLAPCNFSACTDYYKPCEYWSQCHGATYTGSPQWEVISSDAK